MSTADTTPMNGAQALITSLVEAGVDVCFMNPGTSEMHVVRAMPRSVPQHLADERVQLGIVVVGLPTICASPGIQITAGLGLLVLVAVTSARVRAVRGTAQRQAR